MKGTLLGIYDLLNRRTESFEEAGLWSPNGDEDLHDFVSAWRPVFSERLIRSEMLEALR